jgi:hypothetical protein
LAIWEVVLALAGAPAAEHTLTGLNLLVQAATLAAHTLRDGDRAMQGAAPDLKQKEE